MQPSSDPSPPSRAARPASFPGDHPRMGSGVFQPDPFPLDALASEGRVLERASVIAALTELGQAMKIHPLLDTNPHNEDLSYLPRAGFTYLGQFVAHDLSDESTPLVGDNPTPAPDAGRASFRLDLDHLYGGGPGQAAFSHLYDPGWGPHEARFQLGPTSGGLLRDLPRAGGAPLTADDRRRENLILSQLTVAFLRFHNAVLGRIQGGQLHVATFPGDTDFKRAWRTVTWHYQWIVVEGLLREILLGPIWNRLKANRTPFFHPAPGQAFQVLPEFTHAAMRYGHSAVRDSYEINARLPHPSNQAHSVLLGAVLNSGRFLTSETNGKLRDEWVVDWRFFFRDLPDSEFPDTLATAKLDTRVASRLHRLPAAFNFGQTGLPPELPVRTLLRGASLGLRTGQQMAARLRAEGLVGEAELLTRDQLLSFPGDRDILLQRQFDEATPLWFYVLREAEIRGMRRQLGPVGSWLVGGTILAALREDPESYLRQAPPGWRPELGDGGDFTMSKLLEVARVNKPDLA